MKYATRYARKVTYTVRAKEEGHVRYVFPFNLCMYTALLVPRPPHLSLFIDRRHGAVVDHTLAPSLSLSGCLSVSVSQLAFRTPDIMGSAGGLWHLIMVSSAIGRMKISRINGVLQLSRHTRWL